MNNNKVNGKHKITIFRKKRIKLCKRKCHEIKKQNLFGLPNMGNTCYLNSILQLVIRNPILKECFLKNGNSNVNNSNNCNEEPNLYTLISCLVKIVYQDKNKKLKPSSNRILEITLKEILVIMRLYSKDYDAQIPYDPLIFYRDFINHLKNEKFAEKILINKLNNIFFGELENCFYCSSCLNIEKINEKFLDLNFNRKNNHLSPINVQITQYFAEEILEDFFCERCNTTRNIILRKEIISLPRILTLSINLAKEFNLDSSSEIIIQGIIFRLYGIVLFNKTTQHYISKIYINNKFYYFDDMIVSDTFDDLSYNPLILIYNKKL